ncbi:CLUMA_CG016100, isoform A [Clunio marinus]|uniref:CLUMA_CG016100, isoform A n=1 Tax=Clunio marinus TaxID=568069 RepID=A0A1J1IRN0_9DIPT|nr:CLUMA_CG016100, isoform A [Clunio marinus]
MVLGEMSSNMFMYEHIELSLSLYASAIMEFEESKKSVREGSERRMRTRQKDIDFGIQSSSEISILMSHR